MRTLISAEGPFGVYADRLPFVLKSFVRMAWTSADAERAWGFKFSRVAAAVIRCEWMSVRLGLRRCALFHLCDQDINRFSREWTAQGLRWQFLRDLSPRRETWWLNVSMRRRLSSRTVVLGNNLDISDFERAWDDQDHESIGRLLGYPQCCRSFFEYVAVSQGCVDTVWAMSNRKENLSAGEFSRLVDGPAVSNILLQSIGIRAVPHAPCSFGCRGTALLAHDLMQIAQKSGVKTEYEWLSSILSWPVEWSGLHGIAEIKTPIVKVCTPTDETGRKYTVWWKGTVAPGEGAKGLSFPFNAPRGTAPAEALVWPTSAESTLRSSDRH
jgi:hypothetical protein